MNKLKSHKSFSGFTHFYEHTSKAVNGKMKFSCFIPDGKVNSSMIWLSGLTCNEENFITKAGAQKYLAEYGIALFCPDTSPRGLDLPGEHESYDFGSGAGFYVDATTEHYKENYKMYSYINEEFYQLIRKEFFSNPVGIFGHSMGGHGALTIGLKNPKKYCSISAFSPIVNPIKAPWGEKAFHGYLGADKKTWEKYDSCELIKSGHSHPFKLLVDQGLSDDFLKEQLLSKNLEAICEEKNQELNLNFRESFDHSYYFIASFIENHIKHHISSL